MTMAETQVESGASGSGGGGGANGAGGGGGAGPPDAVTAAPLLHLHANNNHPLATNNNHRASKQRKRKRLSQVVDKLATQVSSGPTLPPLNNNFHHHNHNHKELDLLKLVKSEPDEDSLGEEAPEPRALKASKTLAAAVVAVAAAAAAAGRGPPEAATPPKEETGAADSVFRFDSTDRERYLFNAISEEDEAEDVFSPASSSNKSPHSSNTDSPKISFSPLRLKDSSVEDELDGAASCTPPSSGRSAGGSSGGGGSSSAAVAAARGPHGPGEDAPRHPGCTCAHCASVTDRFFPASPISPLTPVSPSPAPIYHFEHYLHTKYLPDIFRRRSHSDSDLPMWFEGAKAEGGAETGTTATPTIGGRAASRNPPQPLTLPAPAKGGSLESETSTPQDSPLDLSMKGSRERVGSSTSSESAPPPTPGLDPAATLAAAAAAAAAASGTTPNATLQLQLLTPGFIPPGKTGAAMPVPVVKGDVASPTTKESVAVRYNLEVSPVVEEMPPGSDVAYVCPVCGQMFSLHDRLAKHMASRHKSRAQPDQSSKAYLCEICKRSFARSDMLTRHMRLHTGIKPYTCRICGQVFSRSDHLSTHQRTHTGEKPYRCPQCPYAACRRDMITRHMRTHARYEPGAERPERGRRGRRGGRGRGRGGSRDGGVTDLPPEMTDPGVALDEMGDLPLTDDLLPPDCISPEPPLSPAQGLGSLAVMSPMDTGGHDGV